MRISIAFSSLLLFLNSIELKNCISFLKFRIRSSIHDALKELNFFLIKRYKNVLMQFL